MRRKEGILHCERLLKQVKRLEEHIDDISREMWPTLYQVRNDLRELVFVLKYETIRAATKEQVQHMEDIAQAIEEIHLALKKNGKP